MSAGLTLDLAGLTKLVAKVEAIVNVDETALLTAIGAIGESQTRRRIEEDKRAPDGTAWPANRAGTPILVETGQHLLGSISFEQLGDAVCWGSDWEYAWVHQFGATIKPTNGKALRFATAGGAFVTARQVTIPPRPFVGISNDDGREILDIVSDVWGLAT